MNRRRFAFATRALLAWLMTLSAATALQAQTATGTILGTVRDQSGGVLSDAAITILNVRTGIERTTATNDNGAYVVPALPVGEYDIVAERPGFRSTRRGGVQLQVSQRVEIDLVLEVGTVGTTVVVRGVVPIVQREGGTGGTLVSGRLIRELPLNGRDFFQLSTLAPGVVPPAEGTQNSMQGGAISVNGAREQANNFMLDGVDNNDQQINQIVINPSVDVVEQFRVQSTTYAAEYGRSGGGQFNYVTRSGTNDWHGSAFEFFRNEALDARNFFDRRTVPEPAFERHQFGGTIGGPLARNRTFIFAGYEGTRVDKAFTRVATVPPVAWTQGDFSSMLTGVIDPAPGLDVGQIFDPRTGLPVPGNRIPADAIDPAGAAVAAYYPAPDDPSAAGPTTATVAPHGTDAADQFTVRVDHRLDGVNQLSGRYSVGRQDRVNPFDPLVDPTNVPGFGSVTVNRPQSLAVGLTSSASRNVVNEFRFGFNRLRAGIFQEHRGEDIAGQLGITGLSGDPSRAGRPGVTVGITDALTDPINTPQERRDSTYQFINSTTWLVGRHTLKAGVDIRHVRSDFFLDFFSRGRFTFVGLSGNPIADLLMGVPFVAIRMNPASDTETNLRTNAFNGFVQDDWRIADNLTLNLGLRYDYNQPPVDTRDRLSTPHLDSPSGEFIQFGTRGVPRGGYQPDRNNVAPRAGFAWRPGDSVTTAIRGGYGLFYDVGILNVAVGPRLNPPQFAWELFIGPRPFRNAFSGGALPLTLSGGIDPDYHDGYYHHFSLGVQRELTPDVVLDVAFVGSRGRDLALTIDPNQGPPGGPPVRNPAFGPARIITSKGSSTYDSLQVRLERRFAQRLSFLSAYTWSRSRDTGSAWFSASTANNGFPQNSFDIEAERGPSDFDTPHRYALSFVWEAPSADGWVPGRTLRALLRDWQVTGILALQSGRPFTVFYGPSANFSGTSNGANGGEGLDRPNLTGDPAVRRDPDRWFDPGAFSPPGDTFGNVGRNTLRGDAFKNLDLAVYRNLTIARSSGGARVQLRLEIFNVFNRAHFFLPVGDLTNASAGRVVRAADGRQLQLGVRVDF